MSTRRVRETKADARKRRAERALVSLLTGLVDDLWNDLEEAHDILVGKMTAMIGGKAVITKLSAWRSIADNAQDATLRGRLDVALKAYLERRQRFAPIHPSTRRHVAAQRARRPQN
jgi:hypothetical protein